VPPGRPEWSFRKPTEPKITEFHAQFEKELAKPETDPETKSRLEKYRDEFNECIAPSGTCKFLLCDRPDWNNKAKGKNGQDGEAGRKGEKADRPAIPGY